MIEKKEDVNIYDQIREEMREKQRVEAERQQATSNLFKQLDTNPLDRLKGEKQ